VVASAGLASALVTESEGSGSAGSVPQAARRKTAARAVRDRLIWSRYRYR